MRRKIIVFGGSFSPPTVAHEAIIRACLALPGFSAVWVMLSGDRRDKPMTASDADRVAMLELMKRQCFQGDPGLIISSFELRLPRPTATYRTVAALQQAYPETAFWFVLGADSYRSMATPAWERGQELRDALNLVVVSRDGRVGDEDGHVQRLAVNTPDDVSSTAARTAARMGAPLDALVCPAIRAYIAAKKLYR